MGVILIYIYSHWVVVEAICFSELTKVRIFNYFDDVRRSEGGSSCNSGFSVGLMFFFNFFEIECFGCLKRPMENNKKQKVQLNDASLVCTVAVPVLLLLRVL